MKKSLHARIDGVAISDEDARALWERFSTWMEQNKGDLGGFARQEGFASVHPAVEDGEPVLLASRTDPQRSYVSIARTQVTGGSGGRNKTMTRRRHGGARPKK